MDPKADKEFAVKKILFATFTTLALLGAAGCVGKGPTAGAGIGKGKAPPPLPLPAPAPIIRKG